MLPTDVFTKNRPNIEIKKYFSYSKIVAHVRQRHSVSKFYRYCKRNISLFQDLDGFMSFLSTHVPVACRIDIGAYQKN